MRVNEAGYLEKRPLGAQKRNAKSQADVWRNWWLVRHHGDNKKGVVGFGRILVYVPKKYIGKHVQFKMEVTK